MSAPDGLLLYRNERKGRKESDHDSFTKSSGSVRFLREAGLETSHEN